MADKTQLESHHGVLMRIAGYGVFIIGPAGIGKSSLALELISQGHQLIADDVVEFSKQSNSISGHCPPLLAGLLHTRELGLISVPEIFGQSASQQQSTLDAIVLLQSDFKREVELTVDNTTTFLSHSFPYLTLSTHNPASLSHRIQCWLKMLALDHRPETELNYLQQKIMSNPKHREHS